MIVWIGDIHLANLSQRDDKRHFAPESRCGLMLTRARRGLFYVGVVATPRRSQELVSRLRQPPFVLMGWEGCSLSRFFWRRSKGGSHALEWWFTCAPPSRPYSRRYRLGRWAEQSRCSWNAVKAILAFQIIWFENFYSNFFLLDYFIPIF